MTNIIQQQLQSLANSLTVLHGRVRTAVAGEVSKAVADAVGATLAMLLGGAIPEMHRWTGHPSRASPYGYDDDGWDESEHWEDYQEVDPPAGDNAGPTRVSVSTRLFDANTAAALMLALTVGRWWKARPATTWSALGVSLAVAGTALGGGPLVQAALRVFWAAHRLLAPTDALGAGPDALGRS